MVRLLIQYKSDKPEDIFGAPLKLKGVFKTFDEGVRYSISLLNDITIKSILINDGPQWVRIK